MEHVIDLDFIIYLAGAIASIAAASGTVSKIIKKGLQKTMKESVDKYYDQYSEKFDKKLDQVHEQLEQVHEQLEQSLQSMHDELTEYKNSQHDANERVRRSLLASMRDRLNQAHDTYCKQGWIGAHSLFILEELYSSYKENHGNGFADKQMEDIRSLETRSAESERSHYSQHQN